MTTLILAALLSATPLIDTVARDFDFTDFLHRDSGNVITWDSTIKFTLIYNDTIAEPSATYNEHTDSLWVSDNPVNCKDSKTWTPWNRNVCALIREIQRLRGGAVSK